MKRSVEELRESLDACFIERSCKNCDYLRDDVSIGCIIDLCLDAREYIELLESRTRWISVQERLPAAGQYVLAKGRQGGVFGCRFEFYSKSSGLATGIADNRSKDRVFTHWALLPEDE